jgi:hypothetical protein
MKSELVERCLRISSRLLFILTAAVLVVSCKKGGEDENLADISYQIKTTNRATGPITWTSGSANSKQIEFKGTASGSREEEYIVSFTPPVDFFSANGAVINKASVKPGNYTDVEMNYEMVPSKDYPALQLKGTFNSGTTSVPVTLTFDNYLEIGTQKPSVELGGGKSYTATLVLDLAAITTGVTAAMLSSATRTNGEILLNYSTNPTIYGIILNNINNKMHTVEFQ